RLVSERDFDKHGQGVADLAKLEQRHVSGDDAGALQAAYAVQAGAGAQRDPLGQRLVGHPPVTLQQLQDLAIDAIEFLHGVYAGATALRTCSSAVGSSIVVKSPGSRPSQIACTERLSSLPERVFGSAVTK